MVLVQSSVSKAEGKQKPIPPPLPIPSRVHSLGNPSPSGMSPRKAFLKRNVDDGMERWVTKHALVS